MGGVEGGGGVNSYERRAIILALATFLVCVAFAMASGRAPDSVLLWGLAGAGAMLAHIAGRRS